MDIRLLGILVLIAFFFIALWVFCAFAFDRSQRRLAPAIAQPTVPKIKTPDPVVGYKIAYFEGLEGNYPFQGVTGTYYSAIDSSKSSSGFHMYNTFEDAKVHPQDGNCFLEVVGYGNIQTFGIGHITTKQRVLQIVVGRCQIPTCKYPATGWCDGVMAWLCSFHGRLSNKARGRWNTFSNLEDRLERMQGTRIAIRSISQRRTSGIFKKAAQKHEILPFVPVKQLGLAQVDS